MKKYVLIFGFVSLALCTIGQATLVEKISKTGNEVIIPYEKYS